ncbi:MAG: ComEC/Rec2 family competence protein, partial [Bacillota bacterium]|nr:ComEC/Rec2 family competence protein [Bacillota bacterium]
MIRRPLIFAATGFAAAIITGYYAGTPVLLTLAGGGVLAFLLLRKQLSSEQNARITALLVLVFYVMGSVCFCISDSRFEAQQEAFLGNNGTDENTEISGVISDCSLRRNSVDEEYLQLTVKCDEGRALVRFYELEGSEQKSFVPGRKIAVSGQPEAPKGRRNPGCFDYALYLKSQGITVTMTGEKYAMDENEKISVKGRLFLLRENYISRVARHADNDTAALFRAIMFGDKGEMDQDVLEVFQRNGTAHILAVSGLHIGIIYGFLVWLWRWKKGWVFFCFISVFFTGYAALAGFSPSVVRAVFMVLLHSFAFLTGRRYDLSNAAFLVALLVMARNPFMLFNAGFQMSFLAVLTMALVLPFVEHVYSGVFLSS